MTALLHQIRCIGTPRECGQAHGETLRDLIQATMERWRITLVRPNWPDPHIYVQEFLQRTSYAAVMARWTPELLDEIHGIAAGAAVPFADLLAYNLLDEEWWFSGTHRGQAPGCTVIGLLPSELTAPVLAQTMDIGTIYDGAQTVLHLTSDDRPEALIFTYAGMIGLNGCNADGIGVVVNNLAMLPHSVHGLPVAAVLRGILAQRTLADASRFVGSVPHASGQHYAVGSPEGLLSFECSADGVVQDTNVTEYLLHTNHPLAESESSAGWQPRDTPNSCARYDFIAAQVGAIATQSDVEHILSDQTIPISMAAQPGRIFTFGATSLLLTTPPHMRVTPGPPHNTPFVNLRFRA
jgi:hypothetical protein